MNSFLKKSLIATLISGLLIPSAFSQVKKERETEEQKAARKADQKDQFRGFVILSPGNNRIRLYIQKSNDLAPNRLHFPTRIPQKPDSSMIHYIII